MLAAIVSRQAMKGILASESGSCRFVEAVASADRGDLQVEPGEFRMAAGIEHGCISLLAGHDGYQNFVGSVGLAEVTTKAALACVDCLHKTPPWCLLH